MPWNEKRHYSTGRAWQRRHGGLVESADWLECERGSPRQVEAVVGCRRATLHMGFITDNKRP